MSSQPLRVALVGGGISGLTFAIALARAGANADLDIYESTSAFSEVGAGMGFYPRMWDAMNFLGIDEALKSKGSCGIKFSYRKGDDAQCRAFGESKVPLESYHRAEFLGILADQLPSNYRPHFGKRLVSYVDSPTGPVTLQFKDGTTATCDVLIAADGIKSAARRAMYEKLADSESDKQKADKLREFVKAKWTGQYVYRGLVPREKVEEVCPDHPALSGPVYFMGKDKYFINYPVSQGKMINCGALVSYPEKNNTLHDEPWVSPVSQAQLKAEYATWSKYVRVMTDLLPTPSRWVINSVVDLPTYVSGRVALIGDAAHAMTPHLASGASQGVEDSLLIATLLAQPQANKDTIPSLLQAFDEVRRPMSQNVLKWSYETGEMYYLQSERVKDVSVEESNAGNVSDETLRGLNEDLGGMLTWTWETSAKADRDKSVELFLSKLQG